MNTRYWLIAILVLAAILRLYDLGRGDPMNDEVTYAFRAIGLVDSFNDPGVQSTPWEWFDPNIPWWTRLSFHDHPPMAIWIQHLSMRLLVERLWAFRLPSALLGIASVWLLFLLGRRLYGPSTGLVAAAMLAVTINHVYVSRLGLQESYVIFFVLLALYLWHRAVENQRFFIAAGTALGLGVLAKYTAIVAAPIAAAYLLLFRPNLFGSQYLWLGGLGAVAVLSPVIIYNAMLFRATGHADLQLSYLTDTTPQVWAHSPGKDIGSLGHRVRLMPWRFVAGHSWLFLGLALGAAASLVLLMARRPAEAMRRHALVTLGILASFLTILATGPAFRFLTLATPFMALAAAVLIVAVISRCESGKQLIWLGLAAILAFEIFYSYSSQIAYYPRGPQPWLASALRYENYNWGHNELDAYLDGELKSKYPAITFESKFSFVAAIQDRNIALARHAGHAPYPALFVYHGNFDLAPELWLFDRRLLYHGWPFLNFKEYHSSREAKGRDVFERAGFRTQYFILQTNIVPDPRFTAAVRGLEPISIRRPDGDTAFLIYRR